MTPKVPFFDLSSFCLERQEELNVIWTDLLSSQSFVGGGSGGDKIGNFENAFSAFCGSNHCISVGNGTDALEMALKCTVPFSSLGKFVIVQANTFVATAFAIINSGFKPLWLDVDWNGMVQTQDIKDLLDKHNDNVAAIIIVHMYGSAAQKMDEILVVAGAVPVIEDCSQAHGCLYKNQHVGTFGKCGTFSFYPSKNLGAFGDAGAILTQDPVIDHTLRLLRNQGSVVKNQHQIIGRNSRMDCLQASVLLMGLQHLASRNINRRRVADLYMSRFKAAGVLASNAATFEDAQITTRIPLIDCYAVFHVFPITFSKCSVRDEAEVSLVSSGIQIGKHYPESLPEMLMFSNSSACPVARALARRSLSLPMFPELTMAQVDMVVDSLVMFLLSKQHHHI